MKSFFLGPAAENAAWVREVVSGIFEDWFQWRKNCHPGDGRAISRQDQCLPQFLGSQRHFENVVQELSRRYEREIAKFSPRYVGHMSSEISLPALFGHVMTLLHNPNNVTGAVARVGVRIEAEAIGFLARMAGFDPERATGHFTSGGTIANIEAAVRARDLAFRDLSPARARRAVILAPRSRHYSWQKAVHVLGLPPEALWPIELDENGRCSVPDLEKKLRAAARARRPVVLVVSVVGTTELGVIDPVGRVHALLKEWRARTGTRIWHHVDAAYGGFYRCLGKSASQAIGPDAWRALRALSKADSLTLDPHKLGYVPYASGAFLVRDRRDYVITGFRAPYVEYHEKADHGPFTLEGSRSAAGASATWLTARCIGFNDRGYGRILKRGIRIRRRMAEALEASGLSVRVVGPCESNILCFAAAAAGEPVSRSNARTLRLASAFSPERRDAPFIVSRTTLSWEGYGALLDKAVAGWGGTRDCDGLVLIRMCLMNPFFDSRELSHDFFALFVDAIRQVIGVVKARKSGRARVPFGPSPRGSGKEGGARLDRRNLRAIPAHGP